VRSPPGSCTCPAWSAACEPAPQLSALGMLYGVFAHIPESVAGYDEQAGGRSHFELLHVWLADHSLVIKVQVT
jgi:hypothetical protein